MADSLTKEEHEILALTGELHDRLATIVLDGASRDQDLLELSTHIHAIQNMILAQASARLYPDKYRLLGGVVYGNG